MANYAHCTYLQFRQLVLSRLMDNGTPALNGSPTNVRWADAELKRYSLETFRTWNAASWFTRDRGTFNLTANEPFYDLPSELVGGTISVNGNPPAQTNILGYNLLDQDLLLDIQYALMEPASSNSWIGSEQFTLPDVQDAIEKTRNKFLLDSGIVVTHTTMTAAPPGDGRFGLPDDTVYIRRVAYQPVSPANAPFIPLFREDEWRADAFDITWNTTQGVPYGYSTIDVPKVSVQIIPPPSLNGTLDLLTVQTPTPLNLSTGVLMNIPDDLCWVVKYGALFYLLTKSGEATDTGRAQYCQQRYAQGVQLAQLWNTVQQPFVNGVSMLTATIQEEDYFNTSWQTAAGTGAPTDFITIAPNLIAVAPVPDGVRPYSVACDVVRNFPVPVADTDYVQVGREELDTLVDYTVHLALFREGGQEFADTMPLAQNMLTAAQQYNGILAAETPDLFKIAKQSSAFVGQKPLVGQEVVA
jgi:hypothetical protein